MIRTYFNIYLRDTSHDEATGICLLTRLTGFVRGNLIRYMKTSFQRHRALKEQKVVFGRDETLGNDTSTWSKRIVVPMDDDLP